MLDFFNKEIGGFHNIENRNRETTFNGYTYTSHTSLIRIYSKDIVCDLEKLSILPDKTNKCEHPICNDYFWEFLRGFMDGDGCIYVNNNQNKIKLSFCNSNRLFLEYINNKVICELGIGGKIYKEKDKKYNLVYYKKYDVKNILDKIYENKKCIFLKRKFEKYKTYYGSPI